MKIKKILVLLLIAVLSFNSFSTACFAQETANDVVTYAVIDRVNITASECKAIYNKMSGYNSWSSDIANAVVGCMGGLGTVTGGITTVAALIQRYNYNQAKKAFKQGWQSGKGCTMIIYDNAAPTILAN